MNRGFAYTSLSPVFGFKLQNREIELGDQLDSGDLGPVGPTWSGQLDFQIATLSVDLHFVAIVKSSVPNLE